MALQTSGDLAPQAGASLEVGRKTFLNPAHNRIPCHEPWARSLCLKPGVGDKCSPRAFIHDFPYSGLRQERPAQRGLIKCRPNLPCGRQSPETGTPGYAIEAMALSVPIDHTLSAISTTSTNIARFIRSSRSAHANLSLVARELSDLRLVLEILLQEENIPPEFNRQLLPLLDGCCDALVSIDIALAHSVEWTSRSNHEVSRHTGKLEAVRRVIGLALDAGVV